MSVERFVPADLLERYAVHDWRNGLAVLRYANPAEWEDVLTVLRAFRLHHTEIATPGGAKSLIAGRLDGGFKARGWTAKRFDTSITVDGAAHPSPTHEVETHTVGTFKGRPSPRRRLTTPVPAGSALDPRRRGSPGRAAPAAAA